MKEHLTGSLFPNMKEVMTSTDSKPEGRFFSVGYQGRSAAELMALLRAHRVQVLVDLREKPFSRVPEYNSKRFQPIVEGAGLEYLWWGRSLGGLTCSQESWRTGCRQLADLARTKVVAMMCMERDHRGCHRAALAQLLAQEHGIVTTHL